MINHGARPIGAPADVSELEYISALIQSESADIPLRTDGTISPIDIHHLLLSRHGLRIPLHRIETELFQELAGSISSSADGGANNNVNANTDDVDVEDSNVWVTNDTNVNPNVMVHENENENPGTEGTTGIANDKSSSSEKKTNVNVINSSIELTTAAAASVVTSLLKKSSVETHRSVCLDLVQLTALLCIPELQRFRYESSDHNDEDLLSGDSTSASKDTPVSPSSSSGHRRTRASIIVEKKLNTLNSNNGSIVDAALKILLSFCGIESLNPDQSTNDSIELSASVIRQMLVALEEDDDISDELINEMLYVAATAQVPSSSLPKANDKAMNESGTRSMLLQLPSNKITLDRTTFLNALTADIELLINENVLPYENRPTTHYEDAIRKIKYNDNKKNGTMLECINEEDEEEGHQEIVRSTNKDESIINDGTDDHISGSIHDNDKVNNRNTVQQGWFSTVLNTTFGENKKKPTKIVARDTVIHDNDLQRIWTAPSIDMAADTFKSFWWTVIMWFTIVVLFFAYFVSDSLFSVNSRLPGVDCTTADNVSDFACKCLKGVVVWLEIFVQLAVLGTSFVLLSSFGNSIYHYKSKFVAIAISFLGIIVVLFTTILAYRFSVDTAFFSTNKDGNKIGGKYIYAASLILGIALLLIQITNLLRMLVASDTLTKISQILPIFASSSRKLERNTKRSSAFKLRRMINNALACHVSHERNDISDVEWNSPKSDTEGNGNEENFLYTKDSIMVRHQNLVSNILSDDWHESLSDALYHFEQQRHTMIVPAALGVWQVWREFFFTRRIGYVEGIWIHPRLIAANLAQWLVLILIPFIAIFGVTFASNRSDDLDKLDIKLWEVKVGISVGALFSMLSTFYIAAVYVPSAIASVIGFRSGLIGSLHDPLFLVYRYAIDQTTILYGAAFWGALFTCAILWTLTGVIGFVIVWKEARSFVQTVLATVIGYVITLLLKLLILQILRKTWYGAFYRRKPAAVNVMNIILECWSLGLSSGYIVARVVKLLLVAIFYIGRIDTPLLAPGVGWLFNRLPLDAFPIAFRKDLLSHEAHRHPYIERLSMLFIMKLHNRSNFGCRACATWRILFVRALMPWLRKYRKRTTILDRSSSQFFSSPSRQHGSGVFDHTSNRKHKILQMENDELRKENIALRQQLQKQTTLYRRQSALRSSQFKSDREIFYDAKNE